MEQLSPKEQYDIKKTQKEVAKQNSQKSQAPKNLGRIIIGVAAILVIGGIIFFFAKQGEPLGPDFSREVPYEGDSHLPEGTFVTYQSNPPASGNHWPTPLNDGVYNKEKPDEAVIHSLEHGRIWISYKPSISAEIIAKLEKLGDGQGLIVTPRNANDTDIALAAWNRLDTFNIENGILDEKRVKEFIKRYKNKGPEFVPGNGGGKTYE